MLWPILGGPALQAILRTLAITPSKTWQGFKQRNDIMCLMTYQDHFGGCIESRLMRVKGGSRRTDKVAREVIWLREDGILFKDDNSKVCKNSQILDVLKLKSI